MAIDKNTSDANRKQAIKAKRSKSVSGVKNRSYNVVFDSLEPNGWFSAAPKDRDVSRAIRTNNPGALNISEWQRKRPGFVDVTPPDGSGNRTTIYRTPEHGIGAWYHLLAEIYGFSSSSQFTIDELATRYAGGDEDAADTYVRAWGDWSGGKLKPHTVVHLNSDDELLALARAMFAHEAGQKSPIHDAQIIYAIKAERSNSLSRIESRLSQDIAKAHASDEHTLLQLASDYGIDTDPVKQLINYRNAHSPTSQPRHWAVLDFTRNSKEKRLFVFDVVEKGVDQYYCAHGKGSEGSTVDGFATVFSNRPDSNASSLGIYLCAETYQGDNGYSLRLDGMERSNSNARSRLIVIHGAKYVSEKWIRVHGYLGRSWGCPAVERQFATQVINALKEGSLLIAWQTSKKRKR